MPYPPRGRRWLACLLLSAACGAEPEGDASDGRDPVLTGPDASLDASAAHDGGTREASAPSVDARGSDVDARSAEDAAAASDAGWDAEQPVDAASPADGAA